jgi:NCAIR mutase (PurE)-related protein
MNFAVVWMAPKRDFAVLVVSNQGKGEVAKACDEAAWTLIKEFLLNKKDKKGR